MRPGPILKAAFGLLALAAFSAHAAPPTSIVRDGSLGRAGAVLPTNPGFYEITPAMGKTVGANLFQSFGTFNLGTNDTADFTANAGTQNIIARVTGGSASNIDGTVESAANLYFINPAGILFTANAKLDMNGASVVSTASYAKLSDGTIFYADVNHPINDAGLTSAPVSAFGFLNATPQTVAFFGAYQLQVEGSTGAPDDLDSVVSSNSGGSGLGGVVNIAVAGAMRMAGGGQISANTLGLGDAGSVTVRAGELSVAGADSLGEGSSISSRATAAGNSGIVNVIVGGAVQLSAGGQITAASKEEGDAGSVTVFAGTLAIGETRIQHADRRGKGRDGAGAGRVAARFWGGAVDQPLPRCSHGFRKKVGF